jgi:uncharacterized membrane protein
MTGRLAPAAALVVLWAVATTVGPFSDVTVNDLFVYRTYADLLRDGHLPYVGFGFEYPPLAALPIGLAGLPGTGGDAYALSFAVLMLACALAGQQLAARLAAAAHTPRAGTTVAWLLALQPVVIGASVRTHFDALPIALALGALLAVARARPDAGFVLLGLGTMAKLFPALLVPLAAVWLAARGQRRDAVRGVALFAVVVVGISLPLAGSGYVDSFRFHLDRPVQIESMPATVLFALGGSEVTGTSLRPDRFKSNGLDGGHAELVQGLFAALLAAALVGIAALAARGRSPRHLVLCAFAALLAFVALGKVLSPQYVIWLAPFAALAWAWGERAVAALTGAAIVLTHVEFPSRYFDLVDEERAVVLLVAARNVALLAALTLLAAALARSRPRASAPSSARAPR